MQEQAIEKLRTEINASTNPAVQVIGQFLLQHLEQNPDDAVFVLEGDKSIAQSLEAMRKVAEKKKVGSVAVLSDAEGFAIVLDYFKTETPAPAPTTEPEQAADTEPPKRTRSRQKPQPQPEPEPTSEPAEDLDFDFDALLD